MIYNHIPIPTTFFDHFIDCVLTSAFFFMASINSTFCFPQVVSLPNYESSQKDCCLVEFAFLSYVEARNMNLENEKISVFFGKGIMFRNGFMFD